MTTAAVTYCGVDLTCEYEYSPPCSVSGIGAEVCLLAVRAGAGHDFSDILTTDQTTAIERLILIAHGEDDEEDAAEAYQARRDERAFEGFL
jgi:hypothetical protein